MNQSEERLSAALRELAAASRQGALPELGTMLKDSFRRQHQRRRRLLRMRVALMCVCLAAAASLLLRKPHERAPEKVAMVHTIPPQEFVNPPDLSATKTRRPTPRAVSTNRAPSSASDEFVALPSMEMVPAGDELRVIRLEMPGADLRLVGALVSEEIARRRVTADFVVGHDGTPYAVRLVQPKF